MELTNDKILEILLDIHQQLPVIQERVEQIYKQQQSLCSVPEKLKLLEHRICALEQQEKGRSSVVLSAKGVILAAVLAFGSSILLAFITGNIP